MVRRVGPVWGSVFDEFGGRSEFSDGGRGDADECGDSSDAGENDQVVTRLLNMGDFFAAVAVTLSNGLPSTLEMNLSSIPPKPTTSSASTSNGRSSDCHLPSCLRPSLLLTMVEAVQKGMNEEYDGTFATIE